MSGQKGQSGGRNRLPTQRKRAQGTLRKSRLNLKEPQLEHALPSAPAWLPTSARKHFEAIARNAFDAGVTTRVDGDAVALAAAVLEEYLAADELVRRNGLVLVSVTDSGERSYRNPAAIQRESAWRRYREAIRAFGLDPQSRSTVSAVSIAEKDPFAEFQQKWGNA